MTRSRYTLAYVGGALLWATLWHFVPWLPPDAAINRARTPEVAAWAAGDVTAAILADLIDATNMERYEFALANTPRGKSKPKEPKRYPRPWATNDGTESMGRDPIAIEDFAAWWDGVSEEQQEEGSGAAGE